jgi:hypothetical protein
LRLDKDLPKQSANFVVRPFWNVTEISHIVSILTGRSKLADMP